MTLYTIIRARERNINVKSIVMLIEAKELHISQGQMDKLVNKKPELKASLSSQMSGITLKPTDAKTKKPKRLREIHLGRQGLYRQDSGYQQVSAHRHYKQSKFRVGNKLLIT